MEAAALRNAELKTGLRQSQLAHSGSERLREEVEGRHDQLAEANLELTMAAGQTRTSWKEEVERLQQELEEQRAVRAGQAAALEASEARERGLVTAALTGRGGGELPPLADHCLIVPSAVTARIQEMHIMLGQMLCEALEIELGLVD